MLRSPRSEPLTVPWDVNLMTDAATDRSPSRVSLTEWLRVRLKPLIEGVSRVLIRLGIGPNLLTLVGLLLSGAAAYFAARGEYVRAGVVFAVGASFDALDGTVARLAGKASRFGALFDSTLDRYGEALILSGLAYHMAVQGQVVGVMLAFATLFGSVMVSYVRARSEGLGVENKVGLLTRVERVALLVLALLTRQATIGLWVLAILTHVTVIQRVVHLYRATRDDRK